MKKILEFLDSPAIFLFILLFIYFGFNVVDNQMTNYYELQKTKVENSCKGE